MKRIITYAIALATLSWTSAAAQAPDRPFRVGGQMAVVSSGEFDSDTGFGALLSWFPTELIGADAEVIFYPEDLGERFTFSQSRVEGLFGVTVGPTLGRFRPFGKVRPGFVNFEGAEGPFACPAIYPPLLTCEIARSTTLFALDLGGGLDLFPTDRSFIRVDLGDRMVRYKGPVLDADNEVRDSDFFGHDFRFTVGVGVRF